MLFKITNDTQAMRHVWSHGRQTLVLPGETKTLDLLENNAVFLRRCEKRGDQLHIEALDDAGTEVLKRANAPPQAGNHPRGLGPGAAAPGEIRDGILEAQQEAQREEEARIRELAKQPDPGMLKPARVPRVE